MLHDDTASRGTLVQPVAGSSKTATMCRYDLDRLARDYRVAVRGRSWETGVFGHALTLPAPEDLAEIGRSHYPHIAGVV